MLCPKCNHYKFDICCDFDKERQEYLEDIARLNKQIKNLKDYKEDNGELRRQLTIAQENNHRRNVELDALHYVWCNGGCPKGVHLYSDEVVTQELIDAAIRNTNRLVTWWKNKEFRDKNKPL